MIRLKYYTTLILLLMGCVLHAQDSSFALARTIQADIADFAVDNLGNIYLLNSNNQLKKLSPKGDSLAVFNDVRRYGKVYSMDVTNPLKILLYYREFATIVTVDRFLNIINTVDLRSLNIFQSKAIGLAYDNNIWIYDDLEAKLKRIRDDGTPVSETVDLRQVLDSVPEPSFIADQGGLVYLCDSVRGIYIFDRYGAFQKHIYFSGGTDFTVIDKNVLGRNDKYFFKYRPGSPDLQQEPIPAAYLPAIKIIITPNAVYVLKSSRLEIYSRQ